MSIENLNVIPNISNNTKYWIIRSGIESKYFEEFAIGSCIAIGWDRIDNIEGIRHITEIDYLKSIVLETYPELERLTSTRSLARKISDISNKIFKFINELKIGDIIVTPGKDEVLIGEITGEPYKILDFTRKKRESYEEELIGDLNKGRDVKWFKRINRNDLEPNLKMMLGVYHGISHIQNSQVITEINRAIYSLYIQENEGHSIFKVKSQEEVDFERYAYFIKSLQEIYTLLKPDYVNNKLSIKTNVQSPGPIEIIGDADLINSMSVATAVYFRNDYAALRTLSPTIQSKIVQFKELNPPEHEYEDYDFPCEGTY